MPPTIEPTTPILLTPSTPHHQTIFAGIVHLHAHCILHNGTLATYLPPLSRPKMLTYRPSPPRNPPHHRPTPAQTATVPDPVSAADSTVIPQSRPQRSRSMSQHTNTNTNTNATTKLRASSRCIDQISKQVRSELKSGNYSRRRIIDARASRGV